MRNPSHSCMYAIQSISVYRTRCTTTTFNTNSTSRIPTDTIGNRAGSKISETKKSQLQYFLMNFDTGPPLFGFFVVEERFRGTGGAIIGLFVSQTVEREFHLRSDTQLILSIEVIRAGPTSMFIFKCQRDISR